VSVREAELMRAVCALLDTPLPPIIDLQAARALENRGQTTFTGLQT
jgi:hypothetical protein